VTSFPRGPVRAWCFLWLIGCSLIPPAARAAEPQVLLQEIAPIAFPMWIWHANDDRVFILERRGVIRIWTKEDGLLETPFLDIDSLVGEGGERGLYSIAFHPDYATNRTFFISYHENAGPGLPTLAVYRYRTSLGDPNVADPTSALRIFEVEKPEDIHNGGEIMFGPDGYLWMAFGDGNAGDGGCRVQNDDFWLGKILRIDVDQIQEGVPYSYGIPPDNPFTIGTDPADVIPDEIYAKGFRHPWRFSFDPLNGDVWIGDVGGGAWEEINLIPAGSGGGQNFGWKIMEGNECHSDPVPGDCPSGTPSCFSPEFTPPIFTYSHATVPDPTPMNGCAIIGGFRYRGSAIPELYGRYVFTDFCANEIRTIEEISPGVYGNPKVLVAGIKVPNTMGLDADGELYLGNLNKVYKIVNAAGRSEQSASQRTCLTNMNGGTAEVAKKRLKANTECVKYAGLGRLGTLDGVPPTNPTIAACFAQGLPQRIQTATALVESRERKRCRAPGHPEQLPDFGYTSATTATAAGLTAAASLTTALFGADPDAAIVTKAANPVGAACQQKIAGKVQLLYDQIWKRALDGKNGSLRGRLGSPARNGEDLAGQVLRYVDEDDRRIPTAVNGIAAEVARSCSAQSLATLFPGDCALGTGTAFAECLGVEARCEFCRHFETADGLTVDCDDFDNDADDGSCPSAAELLCAAPGAGVNWDAYSVSCPRLQDYRLFADPADPTQSPNGNGVPFHLTTPLFSDYALKSRFVFLPPGTQATYDPSKPFSLPVGTIIAKTFRFAHDLRNLGLGADLIETRLLIRREFGWIGLPYVWDTSTGEAHLTSQGTGVDVSWIDLQGTTRSTTYQVPSQVQCGDCHSNPEVDGDAPIGVKARLLNTPYPYPGGAENQIDHWTALGILTGAPPSSSAPRLPVWDDPGDGTLEARARAYLESNCAHCHNPDGKAAFTGLDLRHDRALDQGYGICRPSDFELAPGLEYDIVPGAPEDSILSFRMASTANGVKMPELSRSVVHDEGVALVDAWIETLAGVCQ
jgi:uncharacterized repeat protein (TIGR03806 family)